jgi:hypothetical protein
MEAARIPEQLQIDAALTGHLRNLVRQFCNDDWADLSSRWTASFDDIVAEAKRRGLETFVPSRHVSEGFLLLKTKDSYSVVYTERGAHTDRKDFAELEPAFRHWLRESLQDYHLPLRGDD